MMTQMFVSFPSFEVMLFFPRHAFFQSTESGVEILVNEPYDDGPGGSGQFTHKVSKK